MWTEYEAGGFVPQARPSCIARQPARDYRDAPGDQRINAHPPDAHGQKREDRRCSSGSERGSCSSVRRATFYCARIIVRYKRRAGGDIDCPGEGSFRRIMAARFLKSRSANEDRDNGDCNGAVSIVMWTETEGRESSLVEREAISGMIEALRHWPRLGNFSRALNALSRALGFRHFHRLPGL